jgi:hypothetical protein
LPALSHVRFNAESADSDGDFQITLSGADHGCPKWRVRTFRLWNRPDSPLTFAVRFVTGVILPVDGGITADSGSPGFRL